MNQDTSISQLEARAAKLRTELDEITTLIALMKKYQVGITSTRVTEQLIDKAVADAALRSTILTKHARIVRTVEELLADGRRRLSRQLVDELRERGVVVGGADEAARLASYLSREKYKFQSDVKAGGWTLRRLPKQARPDEVGASSGLSFNGSVANHTAG